MKMTALDYLAESADTAALSDLLQALAQSVESAERTARAVATAADRWQENLIHDDLMKIRYDLEDIRIRAISLSGDAFGHSAEAGRNARDLLAQADAAPQEN